MTGPWRRDKTSGPDKPRPSRSGFQARMAAIPPRRRYLIFTFAFIAVVAGLLLTGQFALLAVLLLVCLVYAPRIVEWITLGDSGSRL